MDARATAARMVDATPTTQAENTHKKRRGQKGKSQPKDGSKPIRAGCYFCAGPRKSEDCPHRLESAAAPAESQPKHGGFIGGVRRNLSSAMIASVG